MHGVDDVNIMLTVTIVVVIIVTAAPIVVSHPFPTHIYTYTPRCLQIVSIDYTVSPPSYCVDIDGNLRETEECRISPFKDQATTTDTNTNIEEDDFGGFFSAQSPSPSENGDGIGAGTDTSHGGGIPTSPPHPAPTPTSVPRDNAFRKFLSNAAPSVARRLDQEDFVRTSPEVDIDVDGDYGEFEEAEPEEVQIQVQQQQQPSPSPGNSVFLDKLKSPTKQYQQQSFENGMQVKGPGVVQEYGVAWTLVLGAAVEHLTTGHRILTHLNNDDDSDDVDDNDNTRVACDKIKEEFLNIPRAQEYFTSMGRIYLVASLVHCAAEAYGLFRFVAELHTLWSRCALLWKDLEPIVLEASKRRMPELEEQLEVVAGRAPEVLASLSMDEFPRMLAWSEGLDALTLLPISGVFNGCSSGCVPKSVEWPPGRGRQCLRVLVSFWSGCGIGNHLPPDLE